MAISTSNCVEEHLRPADLAERLHVHVTTVLRWIAQGASSQGRRGLYPVRHVSSRLTLIPASSVQRFLGRIP